MVAIVLARIALSYQQHLQTPPMAFPSHEDGIILLLPCAQALAQNFCATLYQHLFRAFASLGIFVGGSNLAGWTKRGRSIRDIVTKRNSL